ncbi:MAG: AAA family ATPase [Clostridia bacterium]|nr:AAA family ATPase [Clostridia bacterium]
MNDGLPCGLIGHPLSHSFSPELHDLLGGKGYELWDIDPDTLGIFFEKRQFGFVNVTIPYKQRVMAFCDELSETAQKIGSVNTVICRKDGSLYGDNTDACGFLRMAQRAGIDFCGKKVLVLGSGGTSRTACAVIAAEGGSPTVISRSGENNYENLHLHTDADIIVNTTPVGMYPHQNASPLDLSRFEKLKGVLDVVYNPLRTRLLQQAQELHIPCEGGLYMLCAQAARARELYTGSKISEEALENAYRTLLHERQSVVLVGMPGCGKTTVGKLLARKLGKEFADTDALIEEKAGCTVAQIFSQAGEKAFRDLEEKVIAQCCAEGGKVIATGGGAVLRAENRRNLRMNGNVVWIKRPLQELPLEGRPLSKSCKAVEEMYALRKDLYAACADLTVDNASPEACAEKIINKMGAI